jgi:hypothetical protein
MTIATKKEYEEKKMALNMQYAGFLISVKSDPCIIYDTDSKGISQACLDSIWGGMGIGLGCDKPSPYTTANQANKTYGQIIKDTYSLVNGPGVSGCYTNSSGRGGGLTPSVAQMNNINPVKGKSFAKNNNPIKGSSEELCAANCARQSNCYSSTYNSDSKNCWVNMGSYSDWRPPVDGSANDVAFVNQIYKAIYEMETLNNELNEYEIKNNINQIVIPSSGNLNKLLNDMPGKLYKFLTNKDLPTANGSSSNNQSPSGANPTCTASTCSAAGNGGCKPPCGWNENNYCVCGGTGGKDPTGLNTTTGDIKDLNADRAATAKTLEDYKKQLADLMAKQDDSNAALKKQIITIILIVVIGILLILLLSAVAQSMTSGSNNYSGGGAKKMLTAISFNTNSLKRTFGKLFKK